MEAGSDKSKRGKNKHKNGKIYVSKGFYFEKTLKLTGPIHLSSCIRRSCVRVARYKKKKKKKKKREKGWITIKEKDKSMCKCKKYNLSG
jgi:hypothetical protein